MHRILIALILAFAQPIFAAPAITKLEINSEQFPSGTTHIVSWSDIDMEDAETWDISFPQDIEIPDTATRGRCSFRLVISSSETGEWFARMITSNSVERDLPAISGRLDSSFDEELSEHGPWFDIGTTERIKPDQSIQMTVRVEGSAINTITASSWAQCEWIMPPLFKSAFETGDMSEWPDVNP